MIRLFALISCAFMSAAAAQEADPLPLSDVWQADKTVIFDANSIDIDELVWIARPVIVFADSPNDPRFRQQMDLLSDRPELLAERDVIIVTDTNPDARGDLRLRLRPRGFMLVLMGKDGEVELRKPAPWDIREITRSIDKMPLRQQEIEDRRGLE
ncbi:MAG: DUF4174 domain-containing protein [Octadecabacter sp.]|nr:DUF4174 domain-containing protein [Octadecabacter sp.]